LDLAGTVARFDQIPMKADGERRGEGGCPATRPPTGNVEDLQVVEELLRFRAAFIGNRKSGRIIKRDPVGGKMIYFRSSGLRANADTEKRNHHSYT